MKIYQYIKKENQKTLKCFGLTIMKTTYDYFTATNNQNFLGGLLTTKKISDSDTTHKEIKVLGIPVIKSEETNNIRTYKIFNKRIFKLSMIEQFKTKYVKYIDKKHDDIYVLHGNSGEIFLSLVYIIDTLIQKNESKFPLLVATKPYHVTLIKMICPDIPHIYIKKLKLNIKTKSFITGGFRFFLLFDHGHFKQTEINIRQNEIGKYHYFQSILNRFELSHDELSKRTINISQKNETNMLNKVAKIGLNLDKFVFLAPEAVSCKLYDDDFWVTLINTLSDRGYDIFVNIRSDEICLNNAKKYKTCSLNFPEALALAKRAKRIISLRSGFSEILLQSNIPIDVLYTKFKNRKNFNDMSCDHVVSGFGLTQIPFVDKTKIREFNMFRTSANDCLEAILAKL